MVDAAGAELIHISDLKIDVRASVARWLLHSESDNAAAIRHRVIGSLRQTMPIFGGGAVSTVATALTLAALLREPALMVWAGLEGALMTARLRAVWIERSPTNRQPSIGHLLMLELVGAASVGFGTSVAIASGNWTAIVIGWMAVTAFAGETCLRNLGTLRLVSLMIGVGLVPAVAACLISREPILGIAAVLTSLYALRMVTSAARLNGVLIETMGAERENDHRARHDKLTGLLNRAGLEREMELMRNDNPHDDLALFFIDLDNFKSVNDTYGHAAGDMLLRAVSERLLELVGPGDIVARLGGDEFVMISAVGLVQPAEFGAAALAAIKGAHTLVESNSSVTASIGVAQMSLHGSSLNELMEAADVQLYQAKRGGGSRCIVANAPAR